MIALKDWKLLDYSTYIQAQRSVVICNLTIRANHLAKLVGVYNPKTNRVYHRDSEPEMLEMVGISLQKKIIETVKK